MSLKKELVIDRVGIRWNILNITTFNPHNNLWDEDYHHIHFTSKGTEA